MNQRLKDLYSHVSVHATANREHEAAVELLLLVMMADRHISTDEVETIRSISDDSGWETDTFSFDQYIGPASAKVRAALAEHAVDALLDEEDVGAQLEERVELVGGELAPRLAHEGMFGHEKRV